MAGQDAVRSFREWLIAEYSADGRYDSTQVLEGESAPSGELSVRVGCGNRSYYEVRVAPAEEEVQAGFATENRTVNESIEQMVLDNGGDLGELLGDELCDLGEEPLKMEHFFERPAFRFIVRLPLASPEVLQDPATRRRVRAVLKACQVLFQDCVDEARPG